MKKLKQKINLYFLKLISQASNRFFVKTLKRDLI